MNAALIVLGVMGGAVLLVLLWALLTYNRLVGLRAHIREAFSHQRLLAAGSGGVAAGGGAE